MAVIVETQSGRLAGTEEDGLAVFKGVPFAAPPVGQLRFRPPQPVAPWDGVRPADQWTKWAPQPAPNRAAGIGGEEIGSDEDCLTLNIWAPAGAVAGTTGRQPVMVWIHGGGFTTGSGGGHLYRGDRLAAGGAVVVTINYRLGALGFLAHPSLRDSGPLPACGNWGLLDQIAALQWVRENIAHFGGDPGNVTIFGESAGGMSVSTLLGTPAAKGLFHKAIAQSGGPVVDPLEHAAAMAEKLAADLGVADVPGLRSVPVDDLMAAQAALMASAGVGEGGTGTLPFFPTVDGGVLPEPPLTAIRAGLNAEVPLLAGTNLDEMRFFAIGDRGAFNLDEDRLHRRIDRMLGEGTAGPLVDAYRTARSQRGESTTPTDLWFAIATDHVFRVPVTRMLSAQSAQGAGGSKGSEGGQGPEGSAESPRAAAYAYLFTWPSPVFDGVLGSCHALEIPFVLGHLDMPGVALFAGSGEEAETLSRRMQAAWLAFARTGDPATPELGSWPAYDEDRRATMVFDRVCKVTDAPMEPERAYWEGRV